MVSFIPPHPHWSEVIVHKKRRTKVRGYGTQGKEDIGQRLIGRRKGGNWPGLISWRKEGDRSEAGRQE